MENRKLYIRDLVPSQSFVDMDVLRFFGEYGVPKENVPQIWFIDGKDVVADGHNTIYFSMILGFDQVEVQYFGLEEQNIDMIAWIPDQLRDKTTNCQRCGVKAFQDLIGRSLSSN